MFQAIVFLPLLGAILGGLIALAGARARFPGKAPPPGLEDTRRMTITRTMPMLTMPMTTTVTVTTMPSSRLPRVRARSS
jgi:hypothetical protein